MFNIFFKLVMFKFLFFLVKGVFKKYDKYNECFFIVILWFLCIEIFKVLLIWLLFLNVE